MGVAVDTGRGKKRGVAPDINITPLVDVVLVLLIIFMVVTPQLEAGESVEMPNIYNVDPKSKSRIDALTITYTLSGKYFVEKDPLADVGALEARLAQEFAANPARRIILKGDARQEYGKMRELFGRIQRIGFPGVSLMVGEVPNEGPKGPAYVAGLSGAE